MQNHDALRSIQIFTLVSTRGERAYLIFMPAARGPAREKVLNAREPDARKKFFLPVPEARGLLKPVPDARGFLKVR